MVKEKAPAPGALCRGTGKFRVDSDCNIEFPICKISNRAIMDRLPSDCPMAAQNVHAAFVELKNQAWAALDPQNPSDSPSLGPQRRHDACWTCFDELGTHEVVSRLRQGARTEAEFAAVETGIARNGKPPRRPARGSTYV